MNTVIHKVVVSQRYGDTLRMQLHRVLCVFSLSHKRSEQTSPWTPEVAGGMVTSCSLRPRGWMEWQWGEEEWYQMNTWKREVAGFRAFCLWGFKGGSCRLHWARLHSCGRGGRGDHRQRPRQHTHTLQRKVCTVHACMCLCAPFNRLTPLLLLLS